MKSGIRTHSTWILKLSTTVIIVFHLTLPTVAVTMPGSYPSPPFTESWYTGFFETNQWTTSGDNWRIAGQMGNPAPAVWFFPNGMNQYDQSLTSQAFLCDSIIDRSVWMSFDIKLVSIANLNMDSLYVEIFDSIQWHTIGFFTNDDSFDWQRMRFNISEWTQNEYFRFRFRAVSVAGGDIESWYLDNISLDYACAAEPQNFVATVTYENDVKLTWDPPEGTDYQRDMTGYSIYRNNYFLDFTTLLNYIDLDPPYGDFQYRVTALYADCETNGVTANIYVYPVGGTNLADNPEIVIYPNPVSATLNVNLTNDVTEVILYNSQGQKIYEQHILKTEIFKIDTRKLNAGIYFVKLMNNQGDVFSKKIVIAR